MQRPSYARPPLIVSDTNFRLNVAFFLSAFLKVRKEMVHG